MCALKSLMSQVLSNKSLNGFFSTKTWAGGGGSPSPLAPAPPATPHVTPVDKCGERFHLVVFLYIYITFCWKQHLLCCKDVVMFLHLRTIYILDLSNLRLLLWNSFN